MGPRLSGAGSTAAAAAAATAAAGGINGHLSNPASPHVSFGPIPANALPMGGRDGWFPNESVFTIVFGIIVL